MRFNSQHAHGAEPPIIACSERGPKPFSTVATMLYTVAMVGVLLYATAGHWRSGSRLETLWYPTQTANWVVTVNMLVYQGVQKFPETLRTVCRLALIEPDNLPRESERVLRETLHFVRTNGSDAAQVSGQLAVLLAETRSRAEAMGAINTAS